MQRVHAVVLTGGSAFGLAAADGVMAFLEERGIGYHTPWAKVPIVPAAAIYDLSVGSPSIRPTAQNGTTACLAAIRNNPASGSVGAGTGATVGKWRGMEYRMKGGLGTATIRSGEIVVSALAVVNAVGDVIGEDGSILAGARDERGFIGERDPLRTFAHEMVRQHTNTTLVVVATNARLQKVRCTLVAQRSHDGMARAIRPVHTTFDGDIVFALASGIVDAPVDLVAEMGAEATATAIRQSVRTL
jgi:L-aminopeptidase/D-esterase-like protein